MSITDAYQQMVIAAAPSGISGKSWAPQTPLQPAALLTSSDLSKAMYLLAYGQEAPDFNSDEIREKAAPVLAAPEEQDIVRAWRSYSLDYRIGVGPVLRGTRGVQWLSKTLTATCNGWINNGGGVQEHLAAGVCQCGIYSRREQPTEAFGDWYTYIGATHFESVSVAATVVNHGLVAEYEAGYRSEHCTIERMWVLYRAASTPPYLEARLMAEHYGVPCEVVEVGTFKTRLEEGSL